MARRPPTALPPSAPPAVLLDIDSRSMTVGHPTVVAAEDGTPVRHQPLYDWGCPVAQERGAPCLGCRPHTPRRARSFVAGRRDGVATFYHLHLYAMGPTRRGRIAALPGGLIGRPFCTTPGNLRAALADCCEVPLAPAARRAGLDRRKLRPLFGRLLDAFDAAYQPRASRWLALDGVQPVGDTYTHVVDATTGTTLEVLESYDRDTITAWLKTLPGRESIEAVAIDPSRMERAAIRDALVVGTGRELTIFVDLRHVIVLLLKALQKVRTTLKIRGQRVRQTPHGRKVDKLKALLERQEHELDDDQRAWLMNKLHKSPMLLRAWRCKEAFLDRVLTARTPKAAGKRLDTWWRDLSCDVQGYFAGFYQTVALDWRREFLAGFHPDRFGTNQVESLNRRMKVFGRALHGGASHKAIRLRMLQAYGSPTVKALIRELIVTLVAAVTPAPSPLPPALKECSHVA